MENNYVSTLGEIMNLVNKADYEIGHPCYRYMLNLLQQGCVNPAGMFGNANRHFANTISKMRLLKGKEMANAYEDKMSMLMDKLDIEYLEANRPMSAEEQGIMYFNFARYN